VFDVTLPKLNNNDVTYVLTEWLFEEGAEVPADEAVAVVETSKASEDLVVEQGGFLHRVVPAGREYGVGTVIAKLFASEEERRSHLDTAAQSESAGRPGTEVVLTKSALDAAAELGVDPERLRELGKPVVKRRDVEEFAAARAAEDDGGEVETVRLTPVQRAVGEVVTRAHHTIPAAYAVVKVPVDAALDLRRRLLGDNVEVGLPELVVKAVAGLRGRFPMLFGAPREDGTVEIAPGAHVGVTVDLGKGLYIPVVRDAETRSLREIADTMLDFRFDALRGSFKESDLAGGNITVSLNNDDDIVLARPIIFSGQTCMLCLCATQRELLLDAGGAVVESHFVNLGIAYDHRVVNGREAMLFARELRAALCDERALSALAES
jgi:2-oxoglutarate dehydrogenase E2 component (dihydrolipoamide succinyltransferase)